MNLMMKSLNDKINPILIVSIKTINYINSNMHNLIAINHIELSPNYIILAHPLSLVNLR